MIIKRFIKAASCLFLIIHVSCNNNPNDNNRIKTTAKTTIKEDNFQKARNAPDFSLITLELSNDVDSINIINSLFEQYYKSNTVKSDIKQIEFIGEKQIVNLGKAKIFKCKIEYSDSSDLPFNSYGNYYALICENKSAILMFLDKIEFIKRKQRDSSVYVGGTHIYRSYGKFYVYAFDSTTVCFKSMFESTDYTYSYSLDCVSFKNGYLSFSNIDLDGDSLLDIQFKGIKNYYCKDLEVGYNRENKKPISSEKILNEYIAKKKDNDLLEFSPAGADL